MNREQALSLALKYAKAGIPAFPIGDWLNPNTGSIEAKRPLVKGGFTAGSTDPERLREMFADTWGETDIGVGLWLGPANIVALDIDVKGDVDGKAAFDALNKEFGFTSSAVVETASGGWHLWYRKGEDDYVSNTDLTPGINVRADGGYVVAPGTTYKGKSWKWGRGFEYLVQWPEWLRERLAGVGKSTGKDHWKKLDLSKLNEFDIEAMKYMMEMGGTNPRLQNDVVYLTRPKRDDEDRPSANGCSIGFIAPGVIKMFTDGWTTPNGRVIPINQVFNLQEMEDFIEKGELPNQPTNLQIKTMSDDGRPVLANEAFHGAVGQLVRLVSPSVEADPAFLLVSSLVGLSTIIGDGPAIYAGPVPQSCNLFAVMVGDTASGKGASWSVVKNRLNHVDSAFFAPESNHERGGFVSGEALIMAAHKLEEVPADIKLDTEGSPTQVVTDVRMLIKEAEFGRVLRTSLREGNILSAVLREAWDGEPIKHTGMKHGELKAVRHHIGVLAHITPQELLDALSGTEAANGFGNRFLWVVGWKTGSVPTALDEFDYTEEELALLPPEERALALQYKSTMPVVDEVGIKVAADKLDENIRKTKERGKFRVRIAPSANELYSTYYEDLMSPNDNVMAKVLTDRARTQFLRLALTYALLDGSAFVMVEHLHAAYAVLKYCNDSVVFLWKDKVVAAQTGKGGSEDRLAQKILDALKSEGGSMSKLELRKATGSNNKFTEVTEILKNAGQIEEIREGRAVHIKLKESS